MSEEKSTPVFYSNMTRFVSSQNDFAFDLYRVETDQKHIVDKPKATPHHLCKVFMSPQHFKQFLMVANDQLASYENNYGEIKSDLKAPKTVKKNVKK
jgi:hypothetical protein